MLLSFIVRGYLCKKIKKILFTSDNVDGEMLESIIDSSDFKR